MLFRSITKECEVCGKQYTVTRFFVTKRTSRYCSRECQNAAYSVLRAGENNVNWRGGTVIGRGPNWKEQRKKALKRDDYKCQICGKKIGRKAWDTAVHHIKAYREFDGDYFNANKLTNLITLCRNCHPKVEFGHLPCPRPLF